MNPQPVKPFKLLLLVALGSFLTTFQSFAQYDTVWTGTAGDFLAPANWSVLVPTNNNTFNIDNGGTAVIDTGGAVAFNYFDLGDTGTGYGNLQINNGEVHMAEAPGDSYAQVGLNDTVNSSFVMNGGTVYYDGPQASVVLAETGYDITGELWTNAVLYAAGVQNSGVNRLTLNIGAAPSTGGAMGSLELHSNAVMRIASSLSIAGGNTVAPNFEQASLVMDGDAELSVGDGLGLGKLLSIASIDMSGNSHLVVGNSMGLDNTNGTSGEGYFTAGSRAISVQTVTLRDNAEIDCMTLQGRGEADILITNNAALKVFNVLAGSGTINYPKTESYFGCQYSTNSLITVAGHGVFYVDTFGLFGKSGVAVSYSNLVNGLSIGNGGYVKSIVGNNSKNQQYAGVGTLEMRDFGTLDLRQGLHLGTYNGPGPLGQPSQGTLRVVGPSATINIGDELRLAINLTNAAVSGIGMIDEVITGPTQSTIHVANRAWLTNGVLKVELQGYTPVGGETYTLVSAGLVDGLPKTNNFSAAPLSPGLVWNVSATSTTLVLKVINTFNIQPSGGNTVVSWQDQQGTTNILQSSTNVVTGYADVVPAATSPYTVNPTNAAMFFRLRQ